MTTNMVEAMGNPFPAPVFSRFGATLSTEKTNELLFSFVRLLLDRLSPAGWERAGLDILAGIVSNDVSFLCHFDPDILDLQAADQSPLRQCLALFSKRADIDIGVDKRNAALRKFQEAARACSLTNATFLAWGQGRFQFRPRVERILHDAQRKISQVLGTAPSLADIPARFGPGATTRTPKKNACPVIKLKSGIQCSTNFSDNAGEVLSTLFNPATHTPFEPPSGGSTVSSYDIREDCFVDVAVHVSKQAFVAKTAKTDRSICVEPQLNGMLQNGLGDLMASLLRKKCGIDIRDQSANQQAALFGSISGVSATLDLSNASDTVALGLVQHLLPCDWFDLICKLRSAESLVEGSIVVNDVTSSMGNGFTFPLETLVFWALAQSAKDATCPDHRIRVLVYGDDIIVPVPAVPLLLQALNDLGFTPNLTKSFWSGHFRESCGKDYVYGTSVRPVYVKDRLTTADAYILRNFFHRASDPLLASFWESAVDPSARLYGPDGYGDGHLIGSYTPILPKAHLGWGGHFFETWSRSVKRLKKDLANTISQRVKFRVPLWDPERKEWRWRGKTSYGRVYHGTRHILVRQLATYTAYSRERDDWSLTGSDRCRSQGEHIRLDRRMPDPQNRDDEDFFVVPGDGAWKRSRVYILESL